MRGGRGPRERHAVHSPPITRVGEEETEQDASDPEANEISSSDEADEMGVDAPGEEMDVDSFDEDSNEAISSGDNDEVGPNEQHDEGTIDHEQDEVVAVNSGTVDPRNLLLEPNMERLGPPNNDIESDKTHQPIGFYEPPPTPPQPSGHRRRGSINIAHWENMGRSTPAVRTGHKRIVNNLILTPSLLPTKAALDEEEGQFFRTFYDQLPREEAESRLRASSIERPRNKRSRRNESQTPHPRNSSQLPVTRIVVNRPESAVPCNGHLDNARAADVSHDEPQQTAPTISASQPDASGSSPPSSTTPDNTPTHRGSSATIAASPTLTHAVRANQNLVRTPQNLLINFLNTDPTAYNTNTLVWNWGSCTYESVLPALFDKEESADLPSDAFEGWFDSLHDVDFPYNGLADFQVLEDDC